MLQAHSIKYGKGPGFYERLGRLLKIGKYKSELFYCHCHSIPCIQFRVNGKQLHHVHFKMKTQELGKLQCFLYGDF